jgi:hypothetical protein
VILDENGVLALATATPEKLVVHSRTQLLEAMAWTVPTIVGTTLYARDEKRIVVVDLVVTDNLRHFERIGGLEIEDWV